tara:strand:- start:5112 stop:5381 length:270 start_codon:yes stop_codon:yes gene_type:complete
MTDAVLPQAVLTPAIAVISTNQLRGIEKSTHQGSKLPIHPSQASLLTPGTLHRIAGIATKRTTGRGETRPVSLGMPVRHMGLSHIEKNK